MSTIEELMVAETPPASTKPPRAKRPPAPPRAPRRPPRPPKPREPLSSRQVLLRSSLTVVAALLFAFGANVIVLSQVQHAVAQQRLHDELAEELAEGTAPVSEGDIHDVLLADGVPLGLLSIPSIGVSEVIVEGTSSATMTAGPGHRRDTVLPGQQGVSVVYGRASAFGGPFARIQELAPGDALSVTTGQGVQRFTVTGTRYAGDPSPAPITAGRSRLTLVTARGEPFHPTGVAYVDAQLMGTAEDAGTRQTTFAALPATAQPLASDTSTVWALVFALQFLIVVEIGAVWAYRRIGAQKTWIVFVPLTVLAGIYVTNQVTILLPNLL